MALLSRFTRDARFQEVAGCPLGPSGSDDEGACARCPFNAVLSGKPRVGCVTSTSPQQLSNALVRLQRIDSAAHRRLTDILEHEQRTPETAGLSLAELDDISGIAGRWAAVCGNDVDERQVVAILSGFAERGRATNETVRVLG